MNYKITYKYCSFCFRHVRIMHLIQTNPMYVVFVIKFKMKIGNISKNLQAEERAENSLMFGPPMCLQYSEKVLHTRRWALADP